jgi:hypothetical protein
MVTVNINKYVFRHFATPGVVAKVLTTSNHWNSYVKKNIIRVSLSTPVDFTF